MNTGLLFAGSLAAEITPQQIADFVTSIGLGQYSESFLNNDIDGEMMLGASDDDFADIVASRLHRVKIITLFKRKFCKSSLPRCSETVCNA